jgi:hypothetical protein
VNKITPFLLVLLGLLVGVPAARLAIPSAESAKPAAKAEEGAKSESPKTGTPAPRDPAALQSESCKPAAGNYPWCMPVRLLRQFFSLPADVEKPRAESLREVVARAKATQYDLRFLVALAPALPDPRMDQALDAIQRGFASLKNRRPGGFPPAPDDFLLDRVWLPWTGAGAGSADATQTAPGILLFRGTGPRVLEVVFVVPETSKLGIQKEAFRESLELIADLQEAAIEPRVSILGPSFSGSVESLRLALKSWRDDRGGLLAFQAASGSATADDLEPVFDELGVSFCRMALPDSVLRARTFQFRLLHQPGDGVGPPPDRPADRG